MLRKCSGWWKRVFGPNQWELGYQEEAGKCRMAENRELNGRGRLMKSSKRGEESRVGDASFGCSFAESLLSANVPASIPIRVGERWR